MSGDVTRRWGLPAREAITLAREANDEATDAVRAQPDRFRAFATLPTSDPQAAAAELERCATQLGHVGAMIHGRTGTRTLDDPAYDDLFATAARLHQPIFDAIPDPSDRSKIASGNATALFRLTWPGTPVVDRGPSSPPPHPGREAGDARQR